MLAYGKMMESTPQNLRPLYMWWQRLLGIYDISFRALDILRLQI